MTAAPTDSVAIHHADRLDIPLPLLFGGGIIAATMVGSIMNRQFQLTRAIAIAVGSCCAWLLLPRRITHPRRGYVLRLTVLVLLSAFLIECIRTYGDHLPPMYSISVISSVVASTAAWFAGAAAGFASRRPGRVVALFGLWLPLIGALCVLFGILLGVPPATGYGVAARQALSGATTVNTGSWFALSLDNCVLFTFALAHATSLMTGERAERWIGVGLVGIASGLLVINASVTPILTGVAGSGLSLLLLRRSRFRSLGRRMLIPLFASGALVASAGTIVLVRRPTLLLPIVLSMSNKNVRQQHNALDGRETIWPNAIHHIWESPLVGYVIDEPSTPETMLRNNNPHNDLLYAALKAGIPTAILLCAAVFYVVVECGRSVATAESKIELRAAQMALAAWISLWVPALASGMLSSPLYANPALAGLTAMGLAIARRGRRTQKLQIQDKYV